VRPQRRKASHLSSLVAQPSLLHRRRLFACDESWLCSSQTRPAQAVLWRTRTTAPSAHLCSGEFTSPIFTESAASLSLPLRI
jgi:hypothetical protein